MQKDSMHSTTPGHMMHNEPVPQESPVKSFHCSHCPLSFKSEVFLFEHLNNVHDYSVDASLRDAGLTGTNKASNDKNSDTTRSTFECQHCDFKASSWDDYKKHETCHKESVNQNVKGKTTSVISANQKAAGAKEISSSAMSTSKTKCTPNSSRDLKTYKKPLQTITKYFKASGSNGLSAVKSTDNPTLLDGTRDMLILQESSSSSGQKSSGVFKVSAKPMIDLSAVSQQFLLNDYLLNADLTPPSPKGHITEAVFNNVGKRTCNESLTSSPAKKVKMARESKQDVSSSADFSFEVSEDEEENRINLVNGDMESPKVYFCKHCDYSDVGIQGVSTHYQSDHPYVRYTSDYIEDPINQSATFRCLHCPIEFVSVASLKKHYTKNHPEAPNVFKMQLRELHLVFKCFLCSFTMNALKALRRHYKEKHPTHEVNNALMYCKYLATGSQEGSSQLNTCEKTPSSERISTESVPVPCEEVKNAPSSQHATSKEADVALFQCNKCKFGHKSVVVMHVHYQKSHPEEAITIDKIKQSSLVTSQTTPEKMSEPQKSVIITDRKKISDSPIQETKEKDKMPRQTISVAQINHSPETSKTHSESPKTKKVESAGDRTPAKRDRKMSTEMDSVSPTSPNAVFYCQFCSYSSTKIKSVVCHHNAKHSLHTQVGIQEIVKYSAEFRKKKLQNEAKATANASLSTSVTKCHAFARAEDLFYCQKCNYGNPSVKGVTTHQSKLHTGCKFSTESVIEYTTLIRDQIQKSKSQAKESSISTGLPLPLLNEGDEHMFFCHFCNYRQSTVNRIVHHYSKTHRGFVSKAKQIRLHTSMVLEQTKKLLLKAAANQEVDQTPVEEKIKKKEKTKGPGKSSSVSLSSSKKASQAQKTLQCPRCAYITQHVYLLRRHTRKIHVSHCSVSKVSNVGFKQGNLQSGHHCEFCVFSHKKATILYKHYQEKHPGRRPCHDLITARLNVGPETSTPLRSGENETKIYPCRACSFKGRSVSGITDHYRAVHPWSVKEDGSVLDVINRKKPSAKKKMEDRSEISGSFETYQVPLEFDNSLDSPQKATESSTELKCPHCPARFHAYHSLKTHLGEHRQNVTEEELQEEQLQVQTNVHIFKCPHCSYVNTNCEEVLCHCLKKHPSLESSADSLHVDEAHLHLQKGCSKGTDPDGMLRYSGYMCKTCPQIHSTLEELSKHCEEDHNQSVPNPPKPAQQSKTHSTQGSVKQGFSFKKKTHAVIGCQFCFYKCTTKVALRQHMHTYHNNTPASSAQDCAYKCILCSKSFFQRRCLGYHYTRIHGKDAFHKYYAPVYHTVLKKSATTSPDHPSSHMAENTSDASQSSTATEENKKNVFKCPKCPYVNACTHGILTHCQMSHPAVVARADELKTTEILVTNMVGCKLGKSSNERGYMCKICPQIHASLKKLKIHLEMDHGKEASHKPNAKVYHQICNMPQPPPLVQHKFKCDMCTYSGARRRYLWRHYKVIHKLDALATSRQLEKYNKLGTKVSYLPEAEPDSEESGQIKCKKCPNLFFYSLELLSAHYSTFHSSDCKLDFTVLYPVSKKHKAIYKCCHCKKRLNGIAKLCVHMDYHKRKKTTENAAEEMAARTEASLVDTITPEVKSTELCEQDELPTLETVEEPDQSNVTLPTSPLSSPSKPADVEEPEPEPEPEPESREDKHTCKQCAQTFMSLKGLRCHERSHAAVAAIKKLDNLPTSALKHTIDKYVVFKSGTRRPFQCSICHYRATVMALWNNHFIKNHQDIIMNPAETDNQDTENTQTAEKETPNSSEGLNNLPEPDEELEIGEKSMYLEPPDVQRQLNHFSLMAEAGASSKANVQDPKLPVSGLLHCEFCNFTTEHSSSIRRHLLNRHGKKMLRCKDCNFFTGLKKNMDMHIETGHSTFESEATHQKDLRCPFCLYQTKNKNNMIDHIILHREERVVPIEVRRPKLSRYLQGIVFRCHKCTFTSASAENLHLHMKRHDDIKPYKCRLCYFDCTQLCNLEAHLCDKHQVVRNHALVGQVSLDQLEARDGRAPEEEEEEEPVSNLENNNEVEDVETEELVMDCNEVSDDTHAKNPAVNVLRENMKLQIVQPHQPQRQGSRKANAKSLTRYAAFNLNLPFKNSANPNAAVPEKHGQDPQERTQNEMSLPDAAKRQGIEKRAEPKVAEGNSADVHFVDCSYPEKERQMSEKQLRGSIDSRKMAMQKREEAAEGRLAGKAQARKLQMKALQDRTSNIEEKVEDDILRHILLLDDDGSIRRTPKKAGYDRLVKIEQDIENEVVENVLSQIILLNEEDSITLAQHPKKHPEDTTAVTPKKSQECFTAERHLLNLTPNSAQVKMSRKKRVDKVSHCKEEHVHNQTNCEKLDYGAMPVLEKEPLNEEPLTRCKEEEEGGRLEQRQDRGDKVITENNKSRFKDWEHAEGSMMQEADNPCVSKGAVTAVDGAAEVRHSAVTEKKLFTCGFCGRNLTNSCELERHILRHGL
ncbi:zinc finger protein 462-like isoform X2 [Scomber scombrus]|uniref:zinc finger protein 462-like isoform X2 n=1 Tax=Scomber scombrus TaxID=13677 RepID=UPI002DDA64E8|nr:zinc finger protein 462-like isoform X2 [Scomber scombrus]